ncbi:MAG TPA: enolase C-terminal domain-like protein [Ktedonobacterales bacterium]
MAMNIRSLEAIPLSVSFKQMFRFGQTNRQESQNVVLKLETEDGLVGYGEACPVAAFTDEDQRSVVEALTQQVAPLLIGRDALDREPLLRVLEQRLPRAPFTRAAVDLALWDLAGKAAGVPISVLLGGRYRERLTLHGSVGWDEPAAMVDVAHAQLAAGYTTLKLYAGRGALDDDLARLEAVRAAVPEHVAFLLDVNGQWSREDCLRALPRLEAIGVTLIEQPLPASDWEGQAEVTRQSTIAIAADEAVFTPMDVAEIGRHDAANVINLGLSKLGGLQCARDCATVAYACGLGVMVGSVLELGIATAAGAQLAASLPDLAFPSYLVGPLKYREDVVREPLVVEDGQIAVPRRPGLGVEIDTDALRRLDKRNQ